ncbi:MAG: hypothetical protein QOJ09_2392, partial [Actinomycetota bacterium]|nr:hypothetical protein [Actinomycetota bacterium]
RVIAEGTAAELKGRLGATIVEVELSDAPAVRVARQELQRVGAVGAGADRRILEVKVEDSGRALLEVVRALDRAGVEPVRIAVREPSLDDVFLQLTGRRPEDDAEGDAKEAAKDATNDTTLREAS